MTDIEKHSNLNSIEMLNSNIFPYLLASFTSNIGRGMYFIALSWYVLKISHSGTQVGLILGISSIPALFLLPLMGTVIDMIGGKKCAVYINLIRGIAVLITSYTMLTYNDKTIQMAVLYVSSIIVFSGEIVFDPVLNYLIRNEYEKYESLLRGNAFLQISIQFGVFVSPAIAGLLIKLTNELQVLIIIGIVYIFSSFLFKILKIKEIKDSTIKTDRNWEKIYHSYKYFISVSLIFIKNLKFLLLISIVAAFEAIVIGVNTLLGPLSVVKNWNAFEYGLLDAFIAIGSLVSGVILGSFFL